MQQLVLALTLGLLIIGCSSKNISHHPSIIIPKTILDSDNDGINDDIDQCPNTPLNVKVDNNGCPVTKTLIGYNMFEYRAFFDQSSATIKPEFKNELLKNIDMLKIRHDIVGAIVGGASAYEGDFESDRMQLSKQRALQVKNQFIQFSGINPSNIIAIACGSHKPIAEETSEDTQAFNRRVYMNVARKGELGMQILDETGKLTDDYKQCEILD